MHELDTIIPAGSVTLAGSLVTPASAGPHPAALLLPGSGELDRDANHRKMPLGLSRDLAELLAGAGWASLRYDKRGVGGSSGDYLSTGFADELSDAEAALRWLRAHPAISRVVVIGHSAGSLHAVELAGRALGVDAAVLLATSAKTGEETLNWQTQQVAEHLVPGIARMLLRVFRTSVPKQQAKAVAKLKATTTDVARIQLVKVNAKWMREFIAYDPVPALGRARVPLLAITGSKDVQVDPADLATVATSARDATICEVKDVDHILRFEPADFSNPKHYARQLAKTIDPRVTEEILAFLRVR
jgi:pimeloyl-ACP methyl ester carboxylesterase